MLPQIFEPEIRDIANLKYNSASIPFNLMLVAQFLLLISGGKHPHKGGVKSSKFEHNAIIIKCAYT